MLTATLKRHVNNNDASCDDNNNNNNENYSFRWSDLEIYFFEVEAVFFRHEGLQTDFQAMIRTVFQMIFEPFPAAAGLETNAETLSQKRIGKTTIDRPFEDLLLGRLLLLLLPLLLLLLLLLLLSLGRRMRLLMGSDDPRRTIAQIPADGGKRIDVLQKQATGKR